MQWIIQPQQFLETPSNWIAENLERFAPLLAKAKAAAMAAVSGFSVGAVAIGESGALYLGTNVEFIDSTYADTIHAEQFAVVSAQHAGEHGLLGILSTERPCGHCRQFLLEAGAPELPIAFYDHDAADSCFIKTTLATLLPSPFTLAGTGQNLFTPSIRKVRLLKPPGTIGKVVMTVAEDPSSLLHTALSAAAQAYCPVTENAWSGLALQLKNGNVYTGSLIESAAFNPTVPPLQSALIQVIANAGAEALPEIRQVLLIESREARFSYETATQNLLRQVSKKAELTVYRAERIE